MRFKREEYLEINTFGQVTRPMFVELFGLLTGLEEEWKTQGATENELSLIAFDWDYVPVIHCGGNTGIRTKRTTKIIEETSEYTIAKDNLGRTTKLFKQAATIPLPLNYPVEDMDSWLKIKPLFEFHEDRINWAEVEFAKQQQAEGALVIAGIPGGFDMPRELMGEEKTCLSYYEDPELMNDIIQTIKECSLKVLERISDKLVIDQLSVHEDLAGKSGPLIGPAQIKQFVEPYFKSVWELLSSRGTKIFDMDSDGNINPILDSFLDCGLNSFHPFEPAAGMDMVKIRKKYGKKIAIRGGIDKHVLRKSKVEIQKELEYKMQPFMLEGGTVFGLDHRIPNGTPLENYRYYVDSGREILGLPPRSPDKQGWQRMAF